MNKKELEAFVREAAKGLKTEKDLNEFSQMLTKITVEAALNADGKPTFTAPVPMLGFPFMRPVAAAVVVPTDPGT